MHSAGTVTCGVCGRPTPVNPRSTLRGLCADCDELVRLLPRDTTWPIVWTLLDGPDGKLWVHAPQPLTVPEALELSAAIVARIAENARSEL